MATENPFNNILKTLEKPDGSLFGKYYSLPALNDPRIEKLPYSIRILLESSIRNCDEFQVKSKDVDKILDWENTAPKLVEIPFKPARVLQDFTGVPAVVDLACMRDAMNNLGGDSNKINPLWMWQDQRMQFRQIWSLSSNGTKNGLVSFETIILAGAEYGSGSSRDWAAKGPNLLGVKAVIAKSFERIHRSNLVGMGVIPLCFKTGEDAETLGLTGHERYSIDLPTSVKEIRPGQDVTVVTDTSKSFTCTLRFDTEVELAYFDHGGILQYVIRNLIGSKQ